jgi:Uma2 family endonuclease
MVMPLTHRRFTVDEFHRMVEARILTEDDRVELLDGEIVEMSPISPRHAGCVKHLARLLVGAAGPTGFVGVQDPIVLGPHGQPQPDVAVLRPRADDYRRAHPGPLDVVLVVEVADTSIHRDRSTKVPLYAAAGLPEVWLVDLPAETIDVFRDPRGGVYRHRRTAGRGETLSPLNLPGVTIRTDEILG